MKFVINREILVRRHFLAAIAAVAISAPVAARDHSFYVGLEAGLTTSRNNDIDEFVTYSVAQNPAAPPAPAPPDVPEFDDVFSTNYNTGSDVAVTGGYDFGWFRVELEVGRKRAGLGDIRADDITDAFLSSLNSTLNRPSSPPDPGAPGLSALTIDDFDVGGHISALSAMLNGMVDIGITDRIFVFAGGGYGQSWVKALGDKDNGRAWQYMAGFRYAISPKLDLGFKYRYFNSGTVAVEDMGLLYAGNPRRLTITSPGGLATDVDQTTNAVVVPQLEGKYRLRSLLVALAYNFGPARP
jgi:opacity protein-like surface antigen